MRAEHHLMVKLLDGTTFVTEPEVPANAGKYAVLAVRDGVWDHKELIYYAPHVIHSVQLVDPADF
jgi:hypothetical protein